MASRYAARRGEVPPDIEPLSRAVPSQGTHFVVYARPQCRPRAAVPYRNVIVRRAARRGEAPPGVKPLSRAVPGQGVHIIAQARPQRRPRAAVPYRDTAGWRATRRSEVPPGVEPLGRAVPDQGMHQVVHARPQRRPRAAIPHRDVIGQHATIGRGKTAAHIEIAAAHHGCVDRAVEPWFGDRHPIRIREGGVDAQRVARLRIIHRDAQAACIGHMHLCRKMPAIGIGHMQGVVMQFAAIGHGDADGLIIDGVSCDVARATIVQRSKLCALHGQFQCQCTIAHGFARQHEILPDALGTGAVFLDHLLLQQHHHIPTPTHAAAFTHRHEPGFTTKLGEPPAKGGITGLIHRMQGDAVRGDDGLHVLHWRGHADAAIDLPLDKLLGFGFSTGLVGHFARAELRALRGMSVGDGHHQVDRHGQQPSHQTCRKRARMAWRGFSRCDANDDVPCAVVWSMPAVALKLSLRSERISHQ